jgi:hypothetical protein
MRDRIMNARPLILSAALGVASALGGCASSSDMVDKVQEHVADFNPFGTAKKPLPGERKALFPEGVPGVQQGIPPELVKGAQPDTVAAVPDPAVETKPAAKPRRGEPKPRRVRTAAPARPAPKPRTTRRAPSEPAADTVWPVPEAAAPRGPAARPAAAPAASTPPAQPSQNAWPAPASQPAPTAWPDPPSAR